MTDQIISAIQYIDAHTKVVLQKPKCRVLGDIDGKYSVIDPYFDVVGYPSANEVSLTGLTKTNPASNFTLDVVEGDREKMVQSARAKSAPSPFKEKMAGSYSRPMTSTSWIKDAYFRDGSFSIQSKSSLDSFHGDSSNHTSIKRLTFTPPGVIIGPTDAQDDVMKEIVNKPLVHKPNVIKASSAPPSGRFGVKSSFSGFSGRAKSSYSKRRKTAKSWEKKPGPFLTVKVTGQDLWVVSNSTPMSFFQANQDDGLRTRNSKMPKWQDTAENVPKIEKESRPIHKRKLGAPAQYTPTVEWLKYDPSAPIKKPPILKSYVDGDNGKYYSIESNMSKKVSEEIEASPGVRIARNGEVLSHSMMVDDIDETGSNKSDESLEEEVDITSLLPTKLSKKVETINAEDEAREEELSGVELLSETEEELSENTDEKSEVSSVKSDDDEDKSEIDGHETDEEKQNEDTRAVNGIQSEDNGQELKNTEEIKSDEKPTSNCRLTADILAKISGGLTNKNPLLQSTDVSSVSNNSSIESLNFQLNFDNEPNKEDGVVWKIIEASHSEAWIDKNKYNQLKLSRQLKLYRKHDPTERSDKERRDKKFDNEIVPLNWSDEVNKNSVKIVDPKTYFCSLEQKLASESKNSYSAVLYKTSPLSPMSESTGVKSSRPHSAYSLPPADGIRQSEKGPSKGYRAPVSTPRSPRSIRSRSASSTGSSASSVKYNLRSSDFMRHGLELASLLNVTNDSLPPMHSSENHVVTKEKVAIVYDDPSQQPTDKDSINKSMVSSIKKHVRVDVPKARYVRSAPVGIREYTGSETKLSLRQSVVPTNIRPNIPSSVQISPINLSGLNEKISSNKTSPVIKRAGKGGSLLPGHDPHQLPSHRSPAPQNSPMSPTAHKKYQFDKHMPEEPNAILREPPPAKHTTSALRASLASRPKNGFAPSSLTRPQTTYGEGRGMRPFQIAFVGNQGSENAKSTSQPQNDSSMYIQIAQPLFVNAKSAEVESNQKILEKSGPTGNKMYDSYMHELANPAGLQSTGLITSKSLGGTSGKSGLSGNTHVRPYKKSALSQRSSSTSVVESTTHTSFRMGSDNSTEFGIKGDQVRLNLDKNISIICRDLEMLKKSKDNIEPASKAHSQASESAATGNLSSVPSTNAPPSGTVDNQPSMAAPPKPTTVHDNSTQWSARTEDGDGNAPMSRNGVEKETPVLKKEQNEPLLNGYSHPSTLQNGVGASPRQTQQGAPASSPDKKAGKLFAQRQKLDSNISIIDEADEVDENDSIMGVTKVTVNIGQQRAQQ